MRLSRWCKHRWHISCGLFKSSQRALPITPIPPRSQSFRGLLECLPRLFATKKPCWVARRRAETSCLWHPSAARPAAPRTPASAHARIFLKNERIGFRKKVSKAAASSSSSPLGRHAPPLKLKPCLEISKAFSRIRYAQPCAFT